VIENCGSTCSTQAATQDPWRVHTGTGILALCGPVVRGPSAGPLCWPTRLGEPGPDAGSR
jgi:hypothetical protein